MSYTYHNLWTELRKQNIQRYLREAKPKFNSSIEVKPRPAITSEEHAEIPHVEITHPNGKIEVINFHDRKAYLQ